jgi:aspartyl-tRNA(Asn)/glutamyl-tRNA(Gln) amidotransferase subunit A
MNDLVYLSAAEALRLFKSRELSPTELMTAIIDHSEEVEPKINAFSAKLFDKAIDRSKEAEKRYLDKSETPGPLEGLPVAIKEAHSIKGLPMTEGSLIDKGNIAEITHPVVERIIAAGGIMHARTTIPEYQVAGFTHSKMWGVTRNPWNLNYSPGGSSGGGTASLAAGTSTLATGSDIGGSIRNPASFSGVVGYKPPYGRIPALPPLNLSHYRADGPMARTVADCALFENVLAGPHPVDLVSLSPKVELPEEFGDIKGWEIAVCIHLGDFPVDSEVETNTYAVAEALRQAGAEVEEVDLNWRKEDIMKAAEIHWAAIANSVVSQKVLDNPDLAMPYTFNFFNLSMNLLQESTFADGLKMEGQIYAELSPLLEKYNALVCPTNGVTGLIAGDDYVDTAPSINGVKLDDYGDGLIMTVPFNILNRCPVLSVPSGRASNGVPTGVQIVGPTYSDEVVFRIGAALEMVRPWFGDPSWRPEYLSI